MRKFDVRQVDTRNVDWTTVRFRKPSAELRQCIKDAQIEDLYSLLDEDQWEEAIRALVMNDIHGDPTSADEIADVPVHTVDSARTP